MADELRLDQIALIDAARSKYTCATSRLRRDFLELVLLSLHGSLEDALRAQALRLKLSAAQQPLPDLLEALSQVPQSPLSPAEAAAAQRLHRLWERIACGEHVVVAGETVDAYRRLVARLLLRYGVLVTPPEEPADAAAGEAVLVEVAEPGYNQPVTTTTLRIRRDGRAPGRESGPRRERTAYPDAELARYVGRVRPSRATSELPLARQLLHRPSAPAIGAWLDNAPPWLAPAVIALSIFLAGMMIALSLPQRSAPTLAPTAALVVPTDYAAGLPTLPVPAEEVTPMATAAVLPPFAPGQTVYVRSEAESLSIRLAPGTAADNPILFSLAPGTAVEIIGGPVERDGYTWWQVRGPLGEGWCAGQYLEAR